MARPRQSYSGCRQSKMDGMAEGRNEAFQGGITSTGTHPATSMQQNVPRAFSPGSVLELPNVIGGVNGESAENWKLTQPYKHIQQQTYSTDGNSIMNV